MKIKKILVEVCKKFSPHQYIYSPGKDGVYYLRVNVFYGGGRYFFFYSGLFKRRRLKRNTWLLELILNRVTKPLRISEGVEKGDYEYEEVYVSAYLMRRLLEQSDKPWTLDELEVYEN